MRSLPLLLAAALPAVEQRLLAARPIDREFEKLGLRFSLEKMVEFDAMPFRRGGKFETIDPELHFYRLVFVFLPGHAIGRNAVVNAAGSGL